MSVSRAYTDFNLETKADSRSKKDFLRRCETAYDDSTVVTDKESLLCFDTLAHNLQKITEAKADVAMYVPQAEAIEDFKDIPTSTYERWNNIISENEDLKKRLQSGNMDERTLRKAFNVDENNLVECNWVDQYLMSREYISNLVLPCLSSQEEMVDLFGDAENVKRCAPEHWKAEISKTRIERAKLIKVGVDVPAIWEIRDKKGEMVCDLYLTFTWKVKARRDEIWFSASRVFIKPVWSVGARDGKLITNLKKVFQLHDELSCGNEENGLCQIIQRINITGTFSQKFLFRRFPFDAHEMEFSWTYWLSPSINEGEETRGRLIFYEDVAWGCRVRENAMKQSDEWLLIYLPNEVRGKIKCISDLSKVQLDPKYGRRWPTFRCVFHIKRDPQFIKLNYALPITLIVVFGLIGNLTAFYSDFDRSSFTAALLFTIVTIDGNASNKLNQVGYQTTLDTYILCAQIMVVLQGVVGVIFSHIANNTIEADAADALEDYQIPMIFGALGLFCWGILTYRFWTGRELFRF